MKKIYIAGPDVFDKNSIEIGKKYVELCKKYGFEGLYPLDNKVNFMQEKHKIAQDIFDANKAMIEECNIVIANLNSFRGKEPDSGTVWECGYASALGKDVYVYIHRSTTYLEQFGDDEKLFSENGFVDLQEKIIEDFDHPFNLMIANSIKGLVIGSFEDALKLI